MGEYIAQVKNINEVIRDQKPSTSYPAGIKDGAKGYVIYGPPSSSYPNLTIIDYITDAERNVIYPGHYQLMLSYDRTMLVLIESEKIVATFPVFKLEEDKSQQEQIQPTDAKSQRKFDREQKKKEKERKKMIKEGKIPAEEEIYSNATIEYDKTGNYYLIKYERGKVRAWGAIKD